MLSPYFIVVEFVYVFALYKDALFFNMIIFGNGILGA